MDVQVMHEMRPSVALPRDVVESLMRSLVLSAFVTITLGDLGPSLMGNRPPHVRWDLTYWSSFVLIGALLVRSAWWCSMDSVARWLGVPVLKAETFTWSLNIVRVTLPGLSFVLHELPEHARRWGVAASIGVGAAALLVACSLLLLALVIDRRAARRTSHAPGAG